MQTIISSDGTTIAFDEIGHGNPILLVDGALGHRSQPQQQTLARLLSEHFMVINYDRRGRGDSTDSNPYAIEREIEDIEVLIDKVGGTAYVFGMSSGAILALKASKVLNGKVQKLALYEPPFILDTSRSPLSSNYVEDLIQANAENNADKALEIFMTRALLVPEEYLEPMRQDPMWEDMKSTAHTLVYDGIITQDLMRGKIWDADMWSSIIMPTCVIVGEHAEDFIRKSGKVLSDNVANAQLVTLAGQAHNVDMNVLAPTLIDFFD
jgi:pimeloyl-ACP methyl ester carboxylesterase